MTREAQLELKVALMRAALERAEHYDPEWGPDAIARPLGFLLGAEGRLERERRGETPLEAIRRIIVEHAGRSMMRSNAMMPQLRGAKVYNGGKSIVVPLMYTDDETNNHGKMFAEAMRKVEYRP
jgi:hypothetical protein